MKTETKAMVIHVPIKVHAALVALATKEGRSTRVQAVRLITAALGGVKN